MNNQNPTTSIFPRRPQITSVPVGQRSDYHARLPKASPFASRPAVRGPLTPAVSSTAVPKRDGSPFGSRPKASTPGPVGLPDKEHRY